MSEQVRLWFIRGIKGFAAGFLINVALALHFLALNQGFSVLIATIFFSTGLILSVLMRAEVFTGKCFVLGVSVLKKEAKLLGSLGVLAFVLFANILGGTAAGFLLYLSKLDGIIATAAASLSAKLTLDVFALLIKSVLCNIVICVCILVASQYKEKYLVVITALIIAVVTYVSLSFENSVSNIGIISMGLFGGAQATALQILSFFSLNVFGNFLGGVLIALYFKATKYEF